MTTDAVKLMLRANALMNITQLELVRDIVTAARANALEEAAKVAETLEETRIGISCPDGIKGCAVFHFREETRPRTPLEIAAAIRAMIPK